MKSLVTLVLAAAALAVTGPSLAQPHGPPPPPPDHHDRDWRDHRGHDEDFYYRHHRYRHRRWVCHRVDHHRECHWHYWR